MRKRITVVGATFFISLCGLALPATWYVDGSVSTSGDGTSWETAFQKIQAGVNAATHGDTVIVAEGTYLENIRFSGKNIVLTSADPLNQDVVANTVIDGNKAGSVVTFSGNEDETCVLSGFTIRNGSGTDIGSNHYYGGGIYGGSGDNHTLATICNNVVSDNEVTGYYARGGGLAYCDGLIQNNLITRNSAYEYGGGFSNCNGIIENNLIAQNSAWQAAGLHSCHGIIQNNTIARNAAAGPPYGAAGGLRDCYGTIRNCIIWGNTAGRDAQLYLVRTPIYSCIQDWVGGGYGNITQDPIFVDVARDDYRLQAGSPCIDAGISYYWFAWPQRDMDGNCRLAGEGIDIGCYESNASYDTDGDLLSDSDEAASGTDILSEDSDGDGLRDGLEVLRGSKPLECTYPAVIEVPADVATIQECLSMAMEGDEIVVAPGTYQENLFFCGPDVILGSSDPDNPDVVASTILDGSGAAPVVSFTGNESAACVLAGFTICNGDAYAGGGICGGGHKNHSHATIRKNLVTGNFAVPHPGWLAGQHGGGLAYCDGTIEMNTIAGNSADLDGGGLAECNGTIQGNRITENSAYERGGGLDRCNGIIQNNTITRNKANGNGLGGGLSECNGTIRNNTIVYNWSSHLGGGLLRCTGVIRNCIIWANIAATEGPQLYGSSAPTYSCVEGGAGGEGGISQDPRFVDLVWEDYRLLADSPCIDHGKNEDWMWETVDLDGKPRLLIGTSSLRVDMGAYEYYNPVGDSFAPYVEGCYPSPDATDVPINTDIVLHVKDNGNGVYKTSIVITVNGANIIPVITGTPLDYTVTYDPPSDFGYLKSIIVTADARDRCSPGNVMERVTYSFMTEEPPPDTTPPEIILSGDNPMKLRQGTPYAEPGYSATDDRDGNITANVLVTGSVDHTVLGSYVLRYNVSDSAGNPAEEKTRTVNVVEAVPPLITLKGDNPVTLEGGIPYQEPGYTASDNHDGDITANVVVMGMVDNTYPGSYVLTYTVTDSNGNAAEPKRRVVNVVDTTPPLITLQGDNPMTLEIGTPYVEPGYTATDICDGDVTADVVVTGWVNPDVVGNYILLYNVSDSSGNPAEEKTRTVNVVEDCPFEVVRIDEPPAGESIRLTWNSRAGDEYVVWSCTDLSLGDWTQEQAVSSAGDVTSWTDPDPSGFRKFYRVELK